MKPLRLCCPIIVVLLVAACERAKPPVSTDSTVTAVAATSDSSVAALPARDWDSSAGPVLLVVGESPAVA
ncbi:MAG: hypothetical protein ABI205_09295, partial [Gemmatimonadaceae bacterium]